MEAIIVCKSKWKHKLTGKVCKIESRRDPRSTVSEFYISGHNPLPCLTFKGTYGILADWLENNGWVREFNSDVYTPDIICICPK